MRLPITSLTFTCLPHILTLAYGGRKLILTGGQEFTDTGNVNGEFQALDDFYIFDVATSRWSKLAKAPRTAWSPVCATPGDSFIYWED